MTKFKLLLTVLAVAFPLWVLSTAVLAQEEVPSPYAGLKNPFLWNDASVQETGRKLYQQSCLGCHGAKGNNLASSDFSVADYSQRLEERPAFYFWVLSDGRLDKGMPPYKSSLSEEQRWQVLTYLWSLGKEAPPEVTPPSEPPIEGGKTTLQLTVPEQAQSGQPLTLTAVLRDSDGKPIGSVPVYFLLKVDFFARGLMEIGEALTNEQGVVVFEYVPRQTGAIQVVARHQATEATATLTIAKSDERFYEAEAGIRLPAFGKEVFIGPESALNLGEESNAPASALRLPGGLLSWLLLLLATVMLIWFTYFRVLYQVYRIPIVGEIGDTNTRLVPLLGMIIAIVFGILLVLMLITGPYTHLHLLR